MEELPTTLVALIGVLGGGSIAAMFNAWRKPSSPAEAVDAVSEAAAALVGPLTAENERLRREWANDRAAVEETQNLIEIRLNVLETLVRRLLTEVNGAIPAPLRAELEDAVNT